MFFLMQLKKLLAFFLQGCIGFQLVHVDAQVPFCKGAFQTIGPHKVLVNGVIPPQCQSLTLSDQVLLDIPHMDSLICLI